MHRSTADSDKSDFLDGFSGAVINAGTAVDADISIDDVLFFAFGNSLDGAVVSAGAALDTSISDIVCHDSSSICLLWGI